MDERLSSFEAFWPFYVAQHSHRVDRHLHVRSWAAWSRRSRERPTCPPSGLEGRQPAPENRHPTRLRAAVEQLNDTGQPEDL
jgi:hypothetical protein